MRLPGAHVERVRHVTVPVGIQFIRMQVVDRRMRTDDQHELPQDDGNPLVGIVRVEQDLVPGSSCLDDDSRCGSVDRGEEAVASRTNVPVRHDVEVPTITSSKGQKGVGRVSARGFYPEGLRVLLDEELQVSAGERSHAAFSSGQVKSSGHIRARGPDSRIWVTRSPWQPRSNW